MKMTGLDHITVNVKDLDRSKAFYGDVLGLKEAGSVQMGDHTLTYYELPQGVRLELIDYEAKEEPKDIKETDTGTYRHFCLVTPSYVDQLGCRTMLITDPNGVEIEIIQR